jgi:hypothetical protein
MVVGVAFLFALGGGIAVAGPVGSARKEAKEAREELRDARKDGGGPENLAAARENLVKANTKLRETRIERRKAHVEELRTKWKDIGERADAREAIRVHARREARLHRMKAVATELGKTVLVTRIDALIVKEQARFDKKMEELRGKK